MDTKTQIFEVVRSLLVVCDGADSPDGAGFNKPDAGVARYLFRMDEMGMLTDNEIWVAWNMLQKYQNTQRPEIADIPEPKKVAYSRAAKNEFNRKKAEVKKFDKNSEHPHHITVAEDKIEIAFAYEPELVDEVKKIPGRRFNGDNKTWNIPIVEKSLKALGEFILESKCVEPLWTIDSEIYEIIEKASDYRPKPPVRDLTVDEGVLVFKFEKDYQIIDLVKTLGARFNREGLNWRLILSMDNMTDVLTAAEKGGFRIDPAVFAAIEEFSARIAWNQSASTAADTDFEVTGLGGTLRPFQNAGVEFMTRNKSVLLADDMGLGKTVQAIAAIEHNSAYPALIVCPASVRLNWLKEIQKWAPGRTVHFPGKMSKQRRKALGDLTAFEADITIVSYNALKDLCSERPDYKAAIFDESHYLKGYKAQRTKYAMEITSGIEYKFLLTGTPIVNRPKELITQLQILERLGEMGGFGKFVKRYCGAYDTAYGMNIDGSGNLEELNEKLLKSCMVRRNKTEVLKELPAKQRTDLHLQISNRREYEKVQTDLLNFLKDRIKADKEFQKSLKGMTADEKKAAIDAKAEGQSEASARAEQLTRINLLRQVAAKGKLKEGISWIKDFLDTGKKLVVFAHHKEVQNEVFAAIPAEANAVRLAGDLSESKRQDAIDAFQNDPDCKVIVCSLKAGGVGVNLQAASDVVFFEQGWTPGDMMQAEDRCHRMGQQSSVNAWYFLADDTIDSFMYDLISEKRDIIEKAVGGVGSEEKGRSIMRDLIQKIMK